MPVEIRELIQSLPRTQIQFFFSRLIRVRFGSMFADAPIRWTDPSTGPWMFYVWAAFAIAGLAKPAWNWFRRQRAGGWPVAGGRIESVEVSKPSFSFTTK